MNKIIRVTLSKAGVRAALQEYTKWQKWLLDRTKVFIKTLADEGYYIASWNFQNVIYDGTNDVQVKVVEYSKYKRAVVAVGNAVLFIEFGSGVVYPDTHPDKPSDLAARGTYGKGKGSNPKGWHYIMGENGQLTAGGRPVKTNKRGDVVIKTKGNPANMSMYLTKEALERKIERIARMVYQV